MMPVHLWSHRRPKRPSMRNAASGNAGMSQTFWITRSTLELPDLVDVDSGLVPIRREDDGQTDRDLRRGDDEDEDHEHAPALVDRRIAPRERNQREVRRVEHQLAGHENHDTVASNENAGSADEEQHRRDRDERAERN